MMLTRIAFIKQSTSCTRKKTFRNKMGYLGCNRISQEKPMPKYMMDLGLGLKWKPI